MALSGPTLSQEPADLTRRAIVLQHLTTLRAERQALVDADEQFAWLEACEKAGTDCPMGLERPSIRRGCSALCLLRIERERSLIRRAEIDREIAAIEARLHRFAAP